VLGAVILLVRRNVPESPRWMFIHGRDRAADDLVRGIEHEVEAETSTSLDEPDQYITIRQRRSIGLWKVAHTLFARYPRRSILGLSLFIGQAFLYNAITFGFAQILETFFKVPSGGTGWYYLMIAIGNLAGPLLLAPLFDSVGRRPMIAGTYILSGVLLLGTALLFHGGVLNALTLTLCVGAHGIPGGWAQVIPQGVVLWCCSTWLLVCLSSRCGRVVCWAGSWGRS